MTPHLLYETDYDTWLTSQIRSLQEGKLEALDIPHLIDELEGLNRSNERELESYLILLLAHLLKWEYQPDKRSGSWEATIANSRDRITRVLKDQKSLNTRFKEFVPDAYRKAKKLAAKETRLRIDLFPENCPYSIDQLQHEDWLPE